ncbi:MAG: hypothetical protein GXN93_03000 [Candidatus Diapherotrites archaeon]|nr:hypothetical protein [Candidatus Diapherotrites archaeon]
MPSDEELAKAIAEMRKQGLSDDEIRDTLADMGAAPDVIARLLGGSASPAPALEASTSSATAATEPVDAPPDTTPAKEASDAQDSDDLFASMSAGGSDVVSSLIGEGSSESQPDDASDSDTAVPAVQPVSVAPKPLAPPPVKGIPAADVSQTVVQHASNAPASSSASTSVSFDDIAEIKEMLRELKKELRDQRAMLSALQKILQEILDTDRSLIVGLYEKAKK